MRAADEIQFILQRRSVTGLQFSQIAAEFQKKFKKEITAEAVRHVYREYIPGGSGGTRKRKFKKPDETSHIYEDFTHAELTAIKREFKGRNGTFFITAASPVSELSPQEKMGRKGEFGTNLMVGEFKSILNFCRRNSAELIILPLRAHVKALGKQPSHYDPRLNEFKRYFAGEYRINENLVALDLFLNPQQARPLTGLRKIGRSRREYLEMNGRLIPQMITQSVIVGHTKQDMLPLATGNSTHPRILHSTGVITAPEYRKERVGALANEGHIIGGLIVEVEGDKFHVRQVRCNTHTHSFIDLGVEYFPNGRIEKVNAAAVRAGDLHAGMEDPSSLSFLQEIVEKLKPDEIILEDVVDSGSVSKHKAGLGVTQFMDSFYKKGLEFELDYAKDLLTRINSWSDAKVVIVDSNHHDHILQWLDSGRYVKDGVNFQIGHEMVAEVLRGEDPIQKRVDPDGKYHWLKWSDDYYVEGGQMGAHGHLGINGMRGSPEQMEAVYVDGMSGHTHTPQIIGSWFVVGHMSKPRHGYNKGPSTWMPTLGVRYKGGQQQLITVIDGKYQLSPNSKKRTRAPEEKLK